MEIFEKKSESDQYIWIFPWIWKKKETYKSFLSFEFNDLVLDFLFMGIY